MSLNRQKIGYNETIESSGGGREVVKGLSRKVIIVKSPDPKIFEQAIFIVRDEYLLTQGIGQKELLRQAKQAANGYVDRTYGWHRFKNLHPVIYGSAGGAVIGLVWAVSYFFF